MVTASDDTTARIWNAATGAEIAVLKGHSEGLRTAVFSPDGKRVVTACAAQTARVWDAATGAEIVVLRGHEQRVRSAVFSPDGARVATSSEDGTVRIWDATTGKEIVKQVPYPNDFPPDGAIFSPDGRV